RSREETLLIWGISSGPIRRGRESPIAKENFLSVFSVFYWDFGAYKAVYNPAYKVCGAEKGPGRDRITPVRDDELVAVETGDKKAGRCGAFVTSPLERPGIW